MRNITIQASSRLTLSVVAVLLGALSLSNQSSAQGMAMGNCKPVSQRTETEGCWIMADQPIGPLTKAQVFWHLDIYPTRVAAEADRGPSSTVLESLGKVWLLTVEEANWKPLHGQRIAEIGPLPIQADKEYSAQYMEAISAPGMTSSVHMHSGPEAWYTEAGEMCLETSQGVQTGRAGGPPVIVPGGLPMHLTATGTEQRRSPVLILHLSSQPPITLVRDWNPKGLCKN